jgi:hypothetical protein
MASDAQDLMPAAQQFSDDARSRVAGRADDSDFHEVLLLTSLCVCYA